MQATDRLQPSCRSAGFRTGTEPRHRWTPHFPMGQLMPLESLLKQTGANHSITPSLMK